MHPNQITGTKRSNGFLMKLIVTILLLLLLAGNIDVSEIYSILTRLERGSLGVAVLLTFGSVLLSAYKWQLLLKAQGWFVSIYELTKCYFVGLFMNNFLPSSIGGDLMRIYQVGKKIGNTDEAAASVILERLLATIGLVLPAVAAVIPNRLLLGKFLYPILYFFILCLLLTYVVVNPKPLRPLTKIPAKRWQKFVSRLRGINKIIQSYKSKPVAIVKVIIFSVLFQMVVVSINYFLLRAMGIHSISLWQCTLVVPVISAVSMIPVSINGLGVREGAYVLLFGKMGLSSSQAVTLSLLFFTIVTVVSLLGGILFVLEREKESYAITR